MAPAGATLVLGFIGNDEVDPKNAIALIEDLISGHRRNHKAATIVFVLALDRITRTQEALIDHALTSGYKLGLVAHGPVLDGTLKHLHKEAMGNLNRVSTNKALGKGVVDVLAGWETSGQADTRLILMADSNDEDEWDAYFAVEAATAFKATAPGREIRVRSLLHGLDEVLLPDAEPEQPQEATKVPNPEDYDDEDELEPEEFDDVDDPGDGVDDIDEGPDEGPEDGEDVEPDDDDAIDAIDADVVDEDEDDDEPTPKLPPGLRSGDPDDDDDDDVEPDEDEGDGEEAVEPDDDDEPDDEPDDETEDDGPPSEGEPEDEDQDPDDDEPDDDDSEDDMPEAPKTKWTEARLNRLAAKNRPGLYEVAAEYDIFPGKGIKVSTMITRILAAQDGPAPAKKAPAKKVAAPAKKAPAKAAAPAKKAAPVAKAPAVKKAAAPAPTAPKTATAPKTVPAGELSNADVKRIAVAVAKELAAVLRKGLTA